MLRVIFTVLLFTFSMVSNGELYKWVDNNGNTQYTDQPPPAGAAKTEKKLEIKLAPAQPAGEKTNARKSLAERELDFKKRRVAEEQEEAKQQKEAKENKDKCIQAKSKLKLYQEAPKLTVSDGKGGIIRADDAARQKGIDEAQKEIESYCK
jgi:protein subunit release factor B